MRDPKFSAAGGTWWLDSSIDKKADKRFARRAFNGVQPSAELTNFASTMTGWLAAQQKPLTECMNAMYKDSKLDKDEKHHTDIVLTDLDRFSHVAKDTNHPDRTKLVASLERFIEELATLKKISVAKNNAYIGTLTSAQVSFNSVIASQIPGLKKALGGGQGSFLA